jgi:hypothetical protein
LKLVGKSVTEADAGQRPEQRCRITMSASPDLNLFHQPFVPDTTEARGGSFDAHIVTLFSEEAAGSMVTSSRHTPSGERGRG